MTQMTQICFRSKTGIIAHSTYNLDAQTFICLTYLSYGILLWGNSCKSYLNPIVSLQKKALRLLSAHERLNSLNSFCQAHSMLMLNDLFKLNLGKFMYMQMNDNSRVTLPINLLPNNSLHSHNTRQSTQLHSHFSRTANTARSFLFMGPKLWNTLPDQLLNCDSLGMFVQHYKKQLLSEY